MTITEEQILPAYVTYYSAMASVREDPMTFEQFRDRFLQKSNLKLERPDAQNQKRREDTGSVHKEVRK